jgi:hypothetical protein
LPNPSLITKPAKTADMISISSKGLCGEDDFRGLRDKESIISRVKGKNYSNKKVKVCSRYVELSAI